MTIRFHPEATRELIAATDWYENAQEGLGTALLVEITRALDLVAEQPLRWPLWPGLKADTQIRRFLLARFPFAIAYLSLGQEIVVLAVAHVRRQPGYWRTRIR